MHKRTKRKTVWNDLHKVLPKSIPQSLSVGFRRHIGRRGKRGEREREKVRERREREWKRARETDSRNADLLCVWGKQQNTQKEKMGFTPVHQKCRQYWEQSSAISWVHKLIKPCCTCVHVRAYASHSGADSQLIIVMSRFFQLMWWAILNKDAHGS